MKLNNDFEPIREWAEERGILSNSDVKSQFLKLLEEIGELSTSIQNKDQTEQIDALGDCVIVLVNLAALLGFKLEDCIQEAYDVIKKRTGVMSGGTFVKDVTPHTGFLEQNHT